jgi:hypothetical protein
MVRLYGRSLCGRLGRSLDGGIANRGVFGVLITGTSHNGNHQSEHENCDQKQLLHGGISFLDFFSFSLRRPFIVSVALHKGLRQNKASKTLAYVYYIMP